MKKFESKVPPTLMQQARAASILIAIVMALNAPLAAQAQGAHTGHATPEPAAEAAAEAEAAPLSHTEMPPMQGGSAPADARDPDAYANGMARGSGEHALPGVPRLHLGDEHSFAAFQVNRLERVWARQGAHFTAYEGEFKFGRDFEHLVLKAEGEIANGKLHTAHTELLWGHALSAYWDAQLGVRHDSGAGPDRSWLAVGVQGTAPYWIETRATAYLGQGGRAALRLEAEYDAHLTQQLVLQPKTEWNLYSKADRERGIGKGLSSASLGVRLRYEFTPQMAAYIGAQGVRRFGDSGDLARAAGGRATQTRWLAGVSWWF